MGRGDHPNSRKNLKRGNPEHAFTHENASEMQARSTEAKLMLKTFREIDESDTLTQKDREEMWKNLKKRAKHSNQAFETYCKYAGIREEVETAPDNSGLIEALKATADALRNNGNNAV